MVEITSRPLWLDWDVPVQRTPEAPESAITTGVAFAEGLVGATVDFLPFRFLELGVQRGRPVGRIVVRIPGPAGLQLKGSGTGFLIAPDIVMTNHHVLEDAAQARGTVIEFNYETDTEGAEYDPDPWRLDPDSLFVTSPFAELDTTVVAVARRDGVAPGDTYGTIPLRLGRANVAPGEYVNIIQHPDGRRKEVVLHESEVTALWQEGFVHYSSDTLEGSSGAPVFNLAWDLVALHHRGVIERRPDGEPIVENGRYKVTANEGVRLPVIAAFLASNATPADARARIALHIQP
jgi:endonuclease G